MGATVEGGSSSLRLDYAEVAYKPKYFCEDTYTNFMANNMLCAGGKMTDACQGDSGGPILASTSNGYVQVGVVSWGNGCGREGYPGVYADVRTQRHWINEIICFNSVSNKPSMCTQPPSNTPTNLPTNVPVTSPPNTPTIAPMNVPPNAPSAESSCEDLGGDFWYAGEKHQCGELKEDDCRVIYWKSMCPKTCNACWIRPNNDLEWFYSLLFP
eukprot:14023560-Ditylum_brightwellii.AAC.1